MSNRATIVAVSLALGVAWAADGALAQPIEHGRGNIVSIDQDRATVELRDPQKRVATWRFQRDAKVKFTDGAAFYPNPTVRDLRPPMYVHYTVVNQVISSFDVAELGFQPGTEDTGGKYRQQGVPRTVTGTVSAYDPAVRQIAVEHHGLTEAFQLTDRTDRTLDPGTRVRLRTNWSGQRELVSELTVLGSGGQEDSPSIAGNRARERGAAASGRASAAQGRVLAVSANGVLMQVAGKQQKYEAASPSLLKRLFVGKTVRFHWETRDGKPVITKVD